VEIFEDLSESSAVGKDLLLTLNKRCSMSTPSLPGFAINLLMPSQTHLLHRTVETLLLPVAQANNQQQGLHSQASDCSEFFVADMLACDLHVAPQRSLRGCNTGRALDTLSCLLPSLI
jgi:hypothetical protein